MESDEAADLWLADILDDLVQLDHATFVPLIERELRSNPRFARAFLAFTPTAPDEAVNDHLLDLRHALEGA